jgi:hypothetical protein
MADCLYCLPISWLKVQVVIKTPIRVLCNRKQKNKVLSGTENLVLMVHD